MNCRQCIFCRSDSSTSRSVEHIVPESLWNTTNILPSGVVCDACNNYFAREVEKPFLEAPGIAQLRFSEAIPNKRGRIPTIDGKLLPGFPIKAYREAKGGRRTHIAAPPEAIEHLLTQGRGTLTFPAAAPMPSERVVGRFLAKMAIEALAHRLIDQPGGVDYVAEERQLDELRNYARRGRPASWPYHCRRIYPANRAIEDEAGSSHQTVHEFDFLVTPKSEWYFVFALFGLELTINLGGPEIDGYLTWLRENGDASPLYFGRDGSAVAPNT
jgi:hypothetical protein